MDGYLDPFLMSSSWSDVNIEERSFWSCHEPDHLNGLLPNLVGSYESDKEISTVSMINLIHTVENLASQESSSVIPGGDPDFGLDNSLLLVEAQTPQDGRHKEGDSFFNGAVNGSSIFSLGLQSDSAKSALSSPKVVGNMNMSHLPFCESDKVRCYGSELSEYQRTCRDFQSLPPIPQLWTPLSYEGAASLPPLKKDNMQGFGLQGAYAESEIYARGNRYVRDDKTLQLDKLTVEVPMKGKEEWQNHPLSSFMSQPQRTMTTAGLQSPSQCKIQTLSRAKGNNNWREYIKAPKSLMSKSQKHPTSMEKPEVSSIPNIVDLEDDHHLPSFINPISYSGSSKINAISVEQYIDARDLHLSIKATLLGTTPPPPVINLDDYDDDDVKVINFKPSTQTPSSFGSRRKRTRTLSFSFVTETGQSSHSKTDAPFMCEICVEPKSMNEAFSIHGCSHSYCTDCITKYVASKLQDNITSIQCPEPKCTGLLEPDYCRGILPSEVFDRWGNALCESVLLASEKFYCPYKDCSALMILDGDEGEAITQSECPYCKRSFCVQCKAAWHPRINCTEFQEMNKDEREKDAIMLKKLAKKKNWKRCPNCRFYVERYYGCNHMTCRCGFSFCYQCGDPFVANHFCSRTILPSMGLTPPPIVWSSRRIPPPMGLTPPPMVWSSRPIPPRMGTTPHPLSLGSVTQPPPMDQILSHPMVIKPPIMEHKLNSLSQGQKNEMAFPKQANNKKRSFNNYSETQKEYLMNAAVKGLRVPRPLVVTATDKGRDDCLKAYLEKNKTNTSTMPNYYDSNAIHISNSRQLISDLRRSQSKRAKTEH